MSLLLLVTLIACGGPTEPAAPEVPPAAEGDVATDAPSWLAEVVQGVGHCIGTERALFSCASASGKHISLCSDDTLDTLQYRFGPKGTPELVGPADGAISAFTGAHTAWAKGEEHSVRFTNEGTAYGVVSAAGSGIDGPANNYMGVKVNRGGKELAFVQCTDGGEADYLSLLAPWLITAG
jgi:hypothetical protein